MYLYTQKDTIIYSKETKTSIFLIICNFILINTSINFLSNVVYRIHPGRDQGIAAERKVIGTIK